MTVEAVVEEAGRELDGQIELLIFNNIATMLDSGVPAAQVVEMIRDVRAAHASWRDQVRAWLVADLRGGR